MPNVCIKSGGFVYRLELTMALVAGPTALSPSDVRHNPKLIPHKVFSKSVCEKTLPTQIRQFILNISNSKTQVDEFVRELTPAKQV